MEKLWVRILRRQKIIEQSVMELDGASVEEKLVEVCHALDLAVPLWLPKHEKEFSEFQRTAFSADHFMESVSFDRMEIEVFDENSGAKRSSDPRNAFDGF